MKKKFDLNGLLIALNILCDVVLVFLEPKNTDVMDQPQIKWVLILSFLTIIIAYTAQKRANPLLTLLAINLTGFHVIRAVTLRYTITYGFPLIHHVEPTDISKGVIVMVIFSLIMFVLLRGGENREEKSSLDLYAPNYRLAFFLTLVIVLSGFVQKILTESLFKSVLTFVNLVFQKDLALMWFATLSFVLIKHNKARSKSIMLLTIVTVIYVSLDTLGGNKSGIYKMAFYFLFSYLSVYGIPKFRVQQLIGLIGIGVFAVFLYFIGNAVRLQMITQKERVVNLEMIKNALALDQNTYFLALDYGMANVTDRVGYLEVSSKFIRDAEYYQQAINFSHYAKSIVAQVVPKISTFDVVRASNSIEGIERYNRVPTATEFHEHYDYYSEIFTGYAEFYILGGGLLGGVFLLIVVIVLLKRAYFRKFNSKDHGVQYYNKAVIHWVFYSLILDSFGLDWGISRIIFFLLFYFICSRIFIVVEKSSKTVQYL